MAVFVVAFYEIDRAYGGSEEGGWWYDCGTLERLHAVCKTQDAANAIARRANRLLRHLQRNSRGVSSVAYTGGHYCAEVYEDTAPASYPETRPYYE